MTHEDTLNTTKLIMDCALAAMEAYRAWADEHGESRNTRDFELFSAGWTTGGQWYAQRIKEAQ